MKSVFCDASSMSSTRTCQREPDRACPSRITGGICVPYVYEKTTTKIKTKQNRAGKNWQEQNRTGQAKQNKNKIIHEQARTENSARTIDHGRIGQIKNRNWCSRTHQHRQTNMNEQLRKYDQANMTTDKQTRKDDHERSTTDRQLQTDDFAQETASGQPETKNHGRRTTDEPRPCDHAQMTTHKRSQGNDHRRTTRTNHHERMTANER